MTSYKWSWRPTKMPLIVFSSAKNMFLTRMHNFRILFNLRLIAYSWGQLWYGTAATTILLGDIFVFKFSYTHIITHIIASMSVNAKFKLWSRRTWECKLGRKNAYDFRDQHIEIVDKTARSGLKVLIWASDGFSPIACVNSI